MKSTRQISIGFMTAIFTEIVNQETIFKKLKRIISTALLILPVIFTLGCNKAEIVKQELPANVSNSVTSEPYRIQPGDELAIKFYYNPELNEQVTVRPDGKISLQLIDEIVAAGLEPQQLDQNLVERYRKQIRQPTLTVIVVSSASRRIFVGGEVSQPGVTPLIGDMTPLQAIFNQGGFKETASPEASLVIRKGTDNKPVTIRVNLKASMDGITNEQPFFLRPHDIVYVPKSEIAKANKFVDQYIQQLLLFRGVNFGFNINKEIQVD